MSGTGRLYVRIHSLETMMQLPRLEQQIELERQQRQRLQRRHQRVHQTPYHRTPGIRQHQQRIAIIMLFQHTFPRLQVVDPGVQ